MNERSVKALTYGSSTSVAIFSIGLLGIVLLVRKRETGNNVGWRWN
jgi:hypothetical protein